MRGQCVVPVRHSCWLRLLLKSWFTSSSESDGTRYKPALTSSPSRRTVSLAPQISAVPAVLLGSRVGGRGRLLTLGKRGRWAWKKHSTKVIALAVDCRTASPRAWPRFESTTGTNSGVSAAGPLTWPTDRERSDVASNDRLAKPKGNVIENSCVHSLLWHACAFRNFE